MSSLFALKPHTELMPESAHSSAVQDYYENNTHRFLRRGKHGGSLNIHQALWAPGIDTQEEAVQYSNRLVGEAWTNVDESVPPGAILDLGCGVGSSLFYLGEMGLRPSQFIGVSISPTQIGIAQERAKAIQGFPEFHFHTADFLALPALPPIRMAYAIEAFVHAADPNRFMGQLAPLILPGGIWVLVDDFLTPEGMIAMEKDAQVKKWVEMYKSGWLAASLRSPQQLEEIAMPHGLKLMHNQDLTPWMQLGRPRDKMIGLMMKVAGGPMQRSTYFKSLTGGYAKQQCLQNGWMNYRLLIWQKQG